MFMAMTSWGAYRCMKCIMGVFLADKQGKIQPGMCRGTPRVCS